MLIRSARHSCSSSSHIATTSTVPGWQPHPGCWMPVSRVMNNAAMNTSTQRKGRNLIFSLGPQGLSIHFLGETNIWRCRLPIGPFCKSVQAGLHSYHPEPPFRLWLLALQIPEFRRRKLGWNQGGRRSSILPKRLWRLFLKLLLMFRKWKQSLTYRVDPSVVRPHIDSPIGRDRWTRVPASVGGELPFHRTCLRVEGGQLPDAAYRGRLLGMHVYGAVSTQRRSRYSLGPWFEQSLPALIAGNAIKCIGNASCLCRVDCGEIQHAIVPERDGKVASQVSPDCIAFVNSGSANSYLRRSAKRVGTGLHFYHSEPPFRL